MQWRYNRVARSHTWAEAAQNVHHRRTRHRGYVKKTLGPASLAILCAGFFLLVWLAFDSPEVLTAALVVAMLIFLAGALTRPSIR